MADQWNGKSQANALGFSIFLWLIRKAGLSSAYILLKFVAVYYLFFSKRANEGLIHFFSKIKLPQPASLSNRFKAFDLFGQSLIDKLATYMGAGKKLTFDFDNEQKLHELASAGKGALLLGAHLGNWEIAGQLLYRIDTSIHIVMLDNEQQQIKSLLEKHATGKSFSIIPISDDITFVIKIKEALDNGGFVCMHADRYMEGMRTLKTVLFGEEATFPFGPFYMGSRLGSPVAFVYAMKDSKYHYQFSCSEAHQGEKPQELLDNYVTHLEDKASKYPHQWYNFYDFWK
jgi:predicted LPLAT superfamily acyltransferase